MKKAALFVVLAIALGAGSFFFWAWHKQRQEEARQAAWRLKIDDCIVNVIRQNHQQQTNQQSNHPHDIFDQVAQDTEVENARSSCIANDDYNEQHKHDRELYERATKQGAQ